MSNSLVLFSVHKMVDISVPGVVTDRIPEKVEREQVTRMFKSMLISFADHPVQTYFTPERGLEFLVPVILGKVGEQIDLSPAHLLELSELFFH